MAQTNPLFQPQGARAIGSGQIHVHFPSIWSFYNNIGALDRIEKSGVVAGYDHRFNLPELSSLHLGAAIKKPVGTFGLGISRFGGDLFNQQALGIGFSNTLGITSFGLKADWLQTQIHDFGTAGSLVISLGGVAELSPSLFLGASIRNINRAKIGAEFDAQLPTLVQLAIEYRPLKNLGLTLELEKDIIQTPLVKAGLDYALKEWLSLRTGFNSNPARLFAGWGISKKNLILDYAYGTTPPLGTTHHLSLGYLWGD